MARSDKDAAKSVAPSASSSSASPVQLFDLALRLLPQADQFLPVDQGHSKLPLKVDVFRFAMAVDATGHGNARDPIPVHMSEREARAEAARHIAAKAASSVQQSCEATAAGNSDPIHDCTNEQLCELAERVRKSGYELDRLAAAILMPTEDAKKWGKYFDWEESLLASSYAVPIELARIRRKDLSSAP